MSMFDENFSFGGAAASSTANDDRLRRSVSPCSPTTSPYPPPAFSVTDLAASLGRSRLRSEAQICYDPCASYANTDDDAGWAIPSTESSLPAASTRPRGSTFGASSRRQHRQSSARLLCSSAHHRDIAALVARMIDGREQCAVRRGASSASPSSSGACSPDLAGRDADDMADDLEDEGYDSSKSGGECDAATARRVSAARRNSALQYRRSSEFRSVSGGACVSKSVRRRKEKAGLGLR